MSLILEEQIAILEGVNTKNINLTELANDEFREKLSNILDIEIIYSKEEIGKTDFYELNEVDIKYKTNYKIKSLSSTSIEKGNLSKEKLSSLINQKVIPIKEEIEKNRLKEKYGNIKTSKLTRQQLILRDFILFINLNINIINNILTKKEIEEIEKSDGSDESFEKLSIKLNLTKKVNDYFSYYDFNKIA